MWKGPRRSCCTCRQARRGEPGVQYAAVSLLHDLEGCAEACSDGYVTGLEPATNFPNIKSFEKKMGRVVEWGRGSRGISRWNWNRLATRRACSRRPRRSPVCSKPLRRRYLASPTRGGRRSRTPTGSMGNCGIDVSLAIFIPYVRQDPIQLAWMVNQIGSYYAPPHNAFLPFLPHLPPSAAGAGKGRLFCSVRSSCQSDSPPRQARWGLG